MKKRLFTCFVLAGIFSSAFAFAQTPNEILTQYCQDVTTSYAKDCGVMVPVTKNLDTLLYKVKASFDDTKYPGAKQKICICLCDSAYR